MKGHARPTPQQVFLTGGGPEGDRPLDREDFQSMVGGAQAFNRMVRRVSGAHPEMTLDDVKDYVWDRMGGPSQNKALRDPAGTRRRRAS